MYSHLTPSVPGIHHDPDMDKEIAEPDLLLRWDQYIGRYDTISSRIISTLYDN